MKRFGVEGGTRKRCPRENRRSRGRSIGFKSAVHM